MAGVEMVGAEKFPDTVVVFRKREECLSVAEPAARGGGSL